MRSSHATRGSTSNGSVMARAKALVTRQASLSAFRRDLPALLLAHAGEWAAYNGSRRLGVGPSKTALYQKCFALGLKRGEFIVESVEPEISREVDLFLEQQ